MQSITVTIGRNVPARHADSAVKDGLAVKGIGADRIVLTDESWANFTDRVLDALKSFESRVGGLESTWTEIHNGVGAWEGVLEESRKITLFYETDGMPVGIETADLKQQLLSIRTGYYQDAVAVVIGESNLI